MVQLNQQSRITCIGAMSRADSKHLISLNIQFKIMGPNKLWDLISLIFFSIIILVKSTVKNIELDICFY